MDNSLKWPSRFIEMAKLVSTWSKDPVTQVGAVIADHNNRIVSLGYNGFPQKISDNERLHNRNTKLALTLHAETNAILFAKQDLTGCIIITYPFRPCSMCASMIVNSGFHKVIAPKEIPDRWLESMTLATDILHEAGIETLFI